MVDADDGDGDDGDDETMSVSGSRSSDLSGLRKVSGTGPE